MANVRNEAAYQNAIQARIKANARITRHRAFMKEIEADGPDFSAWLFQSSCPESVGLDTYESEEVEQKYHALNREFRKKYGWPVEWLANALRDWGGLTAGQLAVARKSFTEAAERSERYAKQNAERKAGATPWVAGRQTVRGVVKAERQVENDFGYATKWIVETQSGATLWVTAPSAIYDAKVGDLVEMSVLISVAENDATHAFGSRPTKAKKVS